LHLRADDGIRTRDPHLGKVMRYQLRYIRAQRTRSSPGAKDDDSPRKRAHTNLLAWAVSRLSRHPERRLWRCAMSGACYSSTSFGLSAPVPWLSGRASASHAEGRWFDPSRDHPLWRSPLALSRIAFRILCYLHRGRLGGTRLAQARVWKVGRAASVLLGGGPGSLDGKANSG
jgi:hypothetical protein